MAVDLNTNSYSSSGALSGGWNSSFTVTQKGAYRVSFYYQLRLYKGAESDEYIRLQYRNLSDNKLVNGYKLAGGSDQDADHYIDGTISYEAKLSAGQKSLDIGCYLNKITVDSENGECWKRRGKTRKSIIKTVAYF